MRLSDNDILIGTAARFLFESGHQEAAWTLLECDLRSEEDEESLLPGRRIVLAAPTQVYTLLADPHSPVTEAIRDAIGRVIPRAPFIFRNQLDVVVGFPNRASDIQAALIEFARGDDAPPRVIEAPPARPSAPHLLITPLTIFPVENVHRDARLCFIMMPFAPAFDDVYDESIKPAVLAAGLRWQRADDIQETGSILGQIWTALLTARVVIADLTGTNGNVLYELGLAHALGHEAILLTQYLEHVPFDLRQQRVILYAGNKTGREALRLSLTSALQGMVSQASK